MLLAAGSPTQAQDLQVANVDGHLLTDVLDGAGSTAPAAATSAPALTTAVLQAYIARRRAQKGFDMFGDAPAQPQLTSAMVSAYADTHFENAALAAINGAAATVPLAETFSFEPTSDATIRSITSSITDDALAHYIRRGYVPTMKRVEIADHEKKCLSTAIYNEARGESVDGQWAVANVIINRAMSKRFPSTMCGVVYQNADEGRYRCQFTFACDGRTERIAEPGAWARAKRIAASAFAEFQHGRRPGIVPSSALYYHTRAVSPAWSGFREVAEIGAHVFYAPL
jgi:spore germination cell wall hydrolase CwlJ-like protein